MTPARRRPIRQRFDGQMGMEDVETQGASTVVARYGLGARGVDLIERTGGGSVTTGFPLYDAHGNNVATLSRTSNGGYAVNDRRSYDAWGVVRAQQTGGDPKLRYCANLGHRQDDESGLIYMRARYYEPTTGRFVSQDPAKHGGNWFVYCGNNPANRIDMSGKEPLEPSEGMENWFNMTLLVGCAFIASATFAFERGAYAVMAYSMEAALFCLGSALGCFSNLDGRIEMLVYEAPTALQLAITGAILGNAQLGKLPMGKILGAAITMQTFALAALLIDMAFEGIDFNVGG